MISVIKERVEKNDIKPIIDRTYSFGEMVEVHHQVD